MSAAQRGDQDAFAGLVALHQRKAYAIARAIVFVHEDAEDAVQEAFLRAYQAPVSYTHLTLPTICSV